MAEEAGQPRRRRRRRRRHPTITDRMLQILLILYDNAGETRNTDILIRWAISAVMFPLCSALLLFAVPQAFKGELVGLLTAAAELWFVHLWLQLETRMQGLIRYWIARLINIEVLLRPLRRVFSGGEFNTRVRDVRPTTHGVLLSTIRSFRVLGILTIGIFAFATTKTSVYPPPPTPPPLEQVLQQGFQQIAKEMEELRKQIALSQQHPKPEPPKAAQPKKGKRR